jgi:hypothetical protein
LVEKGLLCGGEEGAWMNVGDTGVNRGGISPKKLNYSYILLHFEFDKFD